MQGLDIDIMRENISLGDKIHEIVPSRELYELFAIKNYFNNILAVLTDLKKEANYKVGKENRLESLKKF